MFTDQTVVTKSPTQVRCNKCGNAIDKNDFGYFDDYITISKSWGFHSPIDGEVHDFDICVQCYLEWTRQFIIPPQAKEVV